MNNPHWHNYIEIIRNKNVVAMGIQFNDGKCVIRWQGAHKSIVVWDSLDDLKSVNGHEGTQIVVIEMTDGRKKCMCGLYR